MTRTRSTLIALLVLAAAACAPRPPASAPTSSTTTTTLVTVPCSKAELSAGTQRLVIVNHRRFCVAVP